MSKVYLAKFRQGTTAMSFNAIDYYKEGDSIIKHSWAMGGQTKSAVTEVPKEISGYLKEEL